MLPSLRPAAEEAAEAEAEALDQQVLWQPLGKEEPATTLDRQSKRMNDHGVGSEQKSDKGPEFDVSFKVGPSDNYAIRGEPWRSPGANEKARARRPS
ncbi:hypothetical protein Pflav_011120 [Phytohabitans flavus]|uniref:Uncharacterized protein n=1 Tax=Phytohabitans flavus TaxID=1076124 RepID=A0A6F8XLK8_9ACTN|nr:hypothetical protein Pflav_011120 [Phytohabitans flavus]